MTSLLKLPVSADRGEGGSLEPSSDRATAQVDSVLSADGRRPARLPQITSAERWRQSLSVADASARTYYIARSEKHRRSPGHISRKPEVLSTCHSARRDIHAENPRLAWIERVIGLWIGVAPFRAGVRNRRLKWHRVAQCG